MPFRFLPFALALPLLLPGCASPPAPAPGSTEWFAVQPSHELVIDQGTGFLLSGSADLDGPLPRRGTATIRLDASPDGEPAENPAAERLSEAYVKGLHGSATFHAGKGDKGMIRTAKGRFEAIGELNAARTEFRGTWFFDDLEGGTFHLAPRGTIFP